MNTLGFIGIGTMGLPMAKMLIKKSGEVIKGFDTSSEKMEQFRQAGGIPVKSIAEICQECNFLFISLPTDEILKTVLSEVINQACSGTVVVDLSSTAPHIINELYPSAKKNNILLLDSPVSGGQIGAENGSLVLMCGGERKTFEKAKSYLHFIGQKATYIGPSGSGCIAKLANNIMVGIHIGAMAEAFGFAVKANIEPDVLFEAIQDGFAQSAVLTGKMPKILIGDFRATARSTVHQKDLSNALKLAKNLNIKLPLSSIILEDMEELERQGKGSLDHCALALLYEDRMQVEIRLKRNCNK